MNKNVLIAGIVGVAAVGIGAYALSRSQPKTTGGNPFSGFTGGGATGGYSEPATTDVVKTVLDRVMVNNITPVEELVPEMENAANPSDESADVRQKTTLAAGHVTSRATGETMYSLNSVYSSKGGKTTGHVGGSRRDSTVSRAVENENKG